jgi:DnaJ-class molecular chaperone
MSNEIEYQAHYQAFAKWRSRNQDLENSIEEEKDCENCGGTGECTCIDCGTEHMCGYCEGSGRVDTDSSQEMMTLYEEQLKRDKLLLDKWVLKKESQVS